MAYRVGDLVWAKQQGFSWWPCIVTYDPDHGLFTKRCTDKKSATAKKEVVHVQFLGHERPARAWLSISALQPWAEMKKEHSKQKIKERFLHDWKRALEDCEKTCELARVQRIERHAGVFGRAESDDSDDEGEKSDPAEVVPDKLSRKWTKGMDAKLMKLVLLYGGTSQRWKEITSSMGCGLSVKQVQYRWRGMKKWHENGLLEARIEECTAAALAEGIDLEAMNIAPVSATQTQQCQICSNGAEPMLVCVGGCGSFFHRVCIGLARTPKAFFCDLCYLNEASTDDHRSRSHMAAQRPVTPGIVGAEDLNPSKQLPDARQKGVSRKRHAPLQEQYAKGDDLQEEEEDDDELCVLCSSGADSARMLLCDGCDDGYHLDCLSPKMERIPSGSWFCPTCSAARKDCSACNGSQRAHTCGTVGRLDDAIDEVKSAAVKHMRTPGATVASGNKKRKTGSSDIVPKPATRTQNDATHAAEVESIAALNQSIASYTDSVLSGGGRSRRASTAASTKATDFLRVAQVVQDELDQNVSGHQPKQDDKPQQRVAIWNKRNRLIIKGWKAPMRKHLEKFLWSHPDCEVYNGQDGREAEASEAVIGTSDTHDIENPGEGDKPDENHFRTDPTGHRGVWCLHDTHQCRVCRLGIGWCKRRGFARHLAGPGGGPQPQVAAVLLPRAPAKGPSRIPAGAVCSVSQRPAQVKSVSRRAEKLIEQEKMLTRRGWTTQQVLLQWSADMECLHTVDRVARNLTGRWAHGSSDRWEKRSKTPTPQESAAALEQSRQVANREAELKAERAKQEKQKQAEAEFRRAKQSRGTNPVPPQFQRVCLWNTETRKRLTGHNRPMRQDLNAFLERYPSYVLYSGQDQKGGEPVTLASNEMEYAEAAASESSKDTSEPPLQRHVDAPAVSSARSWTEEEERILFEMFDSDDSENWLEFAVKLGTGRSKKAIQARHARYLNLKMQTNRRRKPPVVEAGGEKPAEAVEGAAAGTNATEEAAPMAAEAKVAEEKTAEEASPLAEIPAAEEAAGKKAAEEKPGAGNAEAEEEAAVAAEEEEQTSKQKAEAATAVAPQQPAPAPDTNSAACGTVASLPDIGLDDVMQKSAPAKSKAWSADDDKALVALVERYAVPVGRLQWGDIARHMGRSAAGCETRWQRYVSPDANGRASPTSTVEQRKRRRSQTTTAAVNRAQDAATDVPSGAQDTAQLDDSEHAESTEQPKYQKLANSETNAGIASDSRMWMQEVGATALGETNAFNASDSHVTADTQQTQTPTISLIDIATDTVPNTTATGPELPNSGTVGATAMKNAEDVCEDSQSTYLPLSTVGPRAMTPPPEIPVPGGSVTAAVECVDLVDAEDSDDGACGDMSPLVERSVDGQQQHQDTQTTVTGDPPHGTALLPPTADSGSVTSNADQRAPHNGHKGGDGKLRYTVGQRLSMRFDLTDGNQGWYPGTIAKVHADEAGSGRFDIMFDDGGMENNVYDIDPDLVIEWPVATDSDTTGVKFQQRKATSVESEAEIATISQRRKRSNPEAYPPVGTQVRVNHDAAPDRLGRVQSKSAAQKWGGQTGVVVGADHGFVRVLFSQEPQSNGAGASNEEASNANRKTGSKGRTVTVAIRLQALEILLPGFHEQRGATCSQDARHTAASNPSQSSTTLSGPKAAVPNDTASLIAAPEDASSTSDVEGSTSPQQQADSASAAAIDGTQQACVRERKLSRRLVECLESM